MQHNYRSRKILNKKYADNFIVDFYGPFEAEYESQFKNKISNINNISYKGFLDLRNQRNYDILANMMPCCSPHIGMEKAFLV